MLSQNHFLAKPAYFGFSSSNFTVQDHILSNVGDALTNIFFKALKTIFGGYI
jgi:hypothetical protein